MYVAIMESETMTWVAKGKTEKSAMKNILTEWNKHQDELKKSDQKYGIINDYYKYKNVEDLDEYYGINVIDLSSKNCVYW